MSKELLENLLIEFDEMGYEPTILCDTKREVDSFRNRLKQVLDYLKAIDNAKPSEALECLEVIGCGREDNMKFREVFEKEYNAILKALLKAQEQEKVLKVIFEKGIDIGWLRQCKTVEEYNYHCEAKHLTQEEFDLLKRWGNDTRTTERV